MSRDWWNRAEPAVGVAGGIWDDVQVSEAYSARWWHPLADGTFAVIIRTYYVADRGAGPFLESCNEYVVCDDWQQLGDTEVWSEAVYVECEGEATAAEAYGAAEWGCRPLGDGEWERVAPEWAVLA